MTPSANELSQQLPPVQPVQQRAEESDEVKRLRGEVARHQTTIDELKRKVTAPPPQPQPQNNQPMNQQDLNREFYKDPVAYAHAIADRVVTNRLQQSQAGNFDTLQRVAKETVRAKDPALFDKYSLEIQAAVDTTDPQFRTNVNVWENAFKYVKGEHIEEIMAARGQQPPAETPRAPAVHVSRGDGPSPSSTPSPSAPSSQQLSPEEKRVARKLGLTEDAYKQGKADYEGQNDMVHDPVGKSSWDNKVTFSTVEARRAKRLAAQRKAS